MYPDHKGNRKGDISPSWDQPNTRVHIRTIETPRTISLINMISRKCFVSALCQFPRGISVGLALKCLLIYYRGGRILDSKSVMEVGQITTSSNNKSYVVRGALFRKNIWKSRNSYRVRGRGVGAEDMVKRCVNLCLPGTNTKRSQIGCTFIFIVLTLGHDRAQLLGLPAHSLIKKFTQGRKIVLGTSGTWQIKTLDKLWLSSWLVTLASGLYSNQLTSDVCQVNLSSQLERWTP